MYEYKAIVRSIYDADTIRADIDLGFGVWLSNQSLRLAGINAPEIRGEERPQGLISRDWLRDRIPTGTEILIRTDKDKRGKYGRWIAVIIHEEVDINALLVEKGLAEWY